MKLYSTLVATAAVASAWPLQKLVEEKMDMVADQTEELTEKMTINYLF